MKQSRMQGMLWHVDYWSSLNPGVHSPLSSPFAMMYLDTFFGGKGEKSNERGAVLLQKPDFQACHFPENCDKIADSIGDGLKIDFLVKLWPFPSWSPKTYELRDGQVVTCPRYRPEKLSISLCKAAFSL